MRCGQCSADNPDSARFCNACGAALAVAPPPPPTPQPPRPAAPPHPAFGALANLILFWRPVNDRSTAETLKLAGLAGAGIFMVETIREAGHSRPEFLILYVLLCGAAVAGLLLRITWLAGIAAGLLLLLTFADGFVTTDDGYDPPIFATLTRVVAALFLANGVRALRFGQPAAPRLAQAAQAQPQTLFTKPETNAQPQPASQPAPPQPLPPAPEKKNRVLAFIAAGVLALGAGLSLVGLNEGGGVGALLAAVAVGGGAVFIALRQSMLAAVGALAGTVYLVGAALDAHGFLLAAFAALVGTGLAAFAAHQAERVTRAPPAIAATFALKPLAGKARTARILLLASAAAIAVAAVICFAMSARAYEPGAFILFAIIMLILAVTVLIAHSRLAAGAGFGLAGLMLMMSDGELAPLVTLLVLAFGAAIAGVVMWRAEN